MQRFTITYSYATTDPHYRGQRTTTLDAVGEKAARALVLAEARKRGDADATVLRVRQQQNA